MINTACDIVVYLSDFCSRNGIDLRDAVTGTGDKISSRDWKMNTPTGT
jgi:hypothetical protein